MPEVMLEKNRLEYEPKLVSVDLGGIEIYDEKLGTYIRYCGKATLQENGKYKVVAIFAGMMAVVEVTLTPKEKQVDEDQNRSVAETS